MVQGGMSCIKYLMFVFNFVFVICGIALIAIGAIVRKEQYTYFLNSTYITAPNILIAVGCIIFILAFLGCCGAVKENHCMVLTFGILLFLIFIVEIAGGIAAYVNRGDLEGFLKQSMNETIQQEKKDAMTVWNEMQQKMKCCGVMSYKDWPQGKIPYSCCDQTPEKDPCTEEKAALRKGCFDELLEEVKSGIGKVGGVAIGIAVVELIGVMFSWCLASAIKKEYEGV